MATVKKAAAKTVKTMSVWLGFSLYNSEIDNYHVHTNRRYVDGFDYLVEVAVPVKDIEKKPKGIKKVVFTK